MFNLRNYIIKLIKGSIGNELDYKIRENALKWLERGVLIEKDLEEIDALLEARTNTNQEEIEETTNVETEEVI